MGPRVVPLPVADTKESTVRVFGLPSRGPA